MALSWHYACKVSDGMVVDFEVGHPMASSNVLKNKDVSRPNGRGTRNLVDRHDRELAIF